MFSRTRITGYLDSFLRWILNDESRVRTIPQEQQNRIDPARCIVFILMHISIVAVIYTGVSWAAISATVLFFFIRMFFITAFYHRYFSHRSYKAGRLIQLIMAILGCTAGQRGPLWWAGHHRHHHAHSDSDEDPHTPRHGFWNSHMLWFLRWQSFAIRKDMIKDWLSYPELVRLERYDWVPFILYGMFCYLLGHVLQINFPQSGTNGPQMLVWGFLISTLVLYHATYTINSLAHRFGSRRFNTKDDSRNNFWLALLTLGEGWHNNHHRYPGAARQGFYWWEIDLTYLMLLVLSRLGVVRELRPVPLFLLGQEQHLARGRAT